MGRATITWTTRADKWVVEPGGAGHLSLVSFGYPPAVSPGGHFTRKYRLSRGKEGRMPLSDHEQRMLDQIESALYAEDPKFASSVRGGNLRAPSARRRLQGVGLFVLGLAMLVAGVAIKATMIGGFPVLSLLGFIVMFGAVVFAITGPKVPGDRDRGPAPGGARRGKASGGSFSSRMEDRFRRRFDE